MLMERCGEGFGTGDPDILPTGEGQLGVFSTLGLELPASLQRGEGRSSPPPAPLAAQGVTVPSTSCRVELLGALKGPRQGQGKSAHLIW